MRVAITGATGFIGRNLVPALQGSGHDVVGIGRSPMGREALAASRGRYEVTDYSRDDLARKLVGVDAIIHLAGRRSQRSDAPLTVAPFINANIGLLETLLDAASSSGVQRFIFASSIAVYSSANSSPYCEGDRVLGLNPYGLSKIAGEALVDLWARAGQMRTTVLRLAAGFGYGERPSAVLMRFLDQATRGDPLIVRGNRNLGIDQVYSRDIVAAFEAALHANTCQGLFNIGAGRAYTLGEMALAVNDVFGRRSGVQFDDVPASDAPAPYMNINAAAEGLGWRPEWPLERALADFHDKCAQQRR